MLCEFNRCVAPWLRGGSITPIHGYTVHEDRLLFLSKPQKCLSFYAEDKAYMPVNVGVCLSKCAKRQVGYFRL